MEKLSVIFCEDILISSYLVPSTLLITILAGAFPTDLASFQHGRRVR